MALIGPAVGPELLTLNQEVYNKGISLSQIHMKVEKKIYYIFAIWPDWYILGPKPLTQGPLIL